jgi:hypothetical protein
MSGILLPIMGGCQGKILIEFSIGKSVATKVALQQVRKSVVV